jgi:hypothetical protein
MVSLYNFCDMFYFLLRATEVLFAIHLINLFSKFVILTMCCVVINNFCIVLETNIKSTLPKAKIQFISFPQWRLTVRKDERSGHYYRH